MMLKNSRFQTHFFAAAAARAGGGGVFFFGVVGVGVGGGRV